MSRLVTLGIIPLLAASKTSNASYVVSIYPRNGGSSAGGEAGAGMGPWWLGSEGFIVATLWDVSQGLREVEIEVDRGYV